MDGIADGETLIPDKVVEVDTDIQKGYATWFGMG